MFVENRISEDIINEMILQYLDNPKYDFTEYYLKYTFLEEDMIKLGKIFDVYLYLKYSHIDRQSLPPLSVLDLYLQNNKISYDVQGIIAKKYQFNCPELIHKYVKYIDISCLLENCSIDFSLKDIAQMIKQPKVGYLFDYNFSENIITEVGEDNLFIICDNIDNRLTEYHNNIYFLTKKGVYESEGTLTFNSRYFPSKG